MKKLLSKYILADGFDILFDFEKSYGNRLYDKITKSYFIDLFGFFATKAISYNHPRLREKDYLEELDRVCRVKVTNSDIYTEEYISFVETFANKVTGKYFRYHFFIDGGALAVENALKTAFDWKVRKNLARNKGERGYMVIHFKEAFHGRGGYTLSLTNTADPNKYIYFPKFNWPRITNPKVRFPIEEHLEEVERLEKQAIDEIYAAIKEYKDDIAAIIIEPIQSEGGDNHFRAEFLRKLREIADENEIFLIFDEVQTGMSTGKWWAFEHFNVVPDAISFAKKFLVGGIAVTTRVDEVEDNVFKVSSRLNSTFGGNICDMVKAKQIIKIVDEENLLEHSAKMGEYILNKLKEMSLEFDVMSNVRGRGMVIAFDMPTPEDRDRLVKEAFNNKLLIFGSGYRTIRFRPALDLTKEEVDEGLKALENSLKTLYVLQRS